MTIHAPKAPPPEIECDRCHLRERHEGCWHGGWRAICLFADVEATEGQIKHFCAGCVASFSSFMDFCPHAGAR